LSELLNILVLHRLGDPLYWRTAVRDLEYLLPDHAGAHRYIVHAADQPLPAYIKDLPFHGIVMGPTFLCARNARHTMAAVLEEFDFVRTSDAFKIALPQDDYDSHAILDRWMVDWRVDVVYAACSEHWDVLYPHYSATGVIRQGYTGYVADSWLDRWRHPRPFAERAIDVSYRARKLPPNFGRIGHIKGVIGERFAAHPATAGLRLDLSTDPGDLMIGPRWHEFLDSSKFCLATNTGSSLLDPNGDIQRCVERYQMRDADAAFEEVEAQCFPGQDGRYSFTAISPRNLEAALAETVQIATPGPYGGILEAHRHYIALEPDCSNAPDVVAQMSDRTLVARIRADARAAVLDRPELRATTQAASLIEQIAAGAAGKRAPSTPPAQMDATVARYRRDVVDQADLYWRHRRRRLRLRNILVALGARKIKRWLTRVD
jgi:hypothetical protein